MQELMYIYWNPDLYAFWGIRWYSLCWMLGLFAAYLLIGKLYREQGRSEKEYEPLFVYCFLGILIGARLGHCIFYQPEYYLTSWKGFIEMLLPIDISPDGSINFVGYEGLASHGGTLGLMLALWLYVKRIRLSYLWVLDNIAIVTPITAFLIRMGNLMNSEIIGKVTDVPWAFIFERVDAYPRHPGQLYEALAYLLLFFIGLWIYRRNKDKVGSGLYFGLCLTYIFTARFFIEYSKEIQVSFEAFLPIDMGQILSIPFIIIGIIYLSKARHGNKEK